MNQKNLLLITLIKCCASWNNFNVLKHYRPTTTPCRLTSSFIDNIPLIPLGSGLAISYAIFKIGGYWRVQLETAKLLGGIPEGLTVLELGVVDGKNIFYLPKRTDYTAIMPVNIDDVKAAASKFDLNERLILESIGKANRLHFDIPHFYTRV